MIDSFILPRVALDTQGFQHIAVFFTQDYSCAVTTGSLPYDFVPVTEFTLGPAYAGTSGAPGSLDVTGSIGIE